MKRRWTKVSRQVDNRSNEFCVELQGDTAKFAFKVHYATETEALVVSRSIRSWQIKSDLRGVPGSFQNLVVPDRIRPAAGSRSARIGTPICLSSFCCDFSLLPPLWPGSHFCADSQAILCIQDRLEVDDMGLAENPALQEAPPARCL
jgi:hypothetical protein